jgi:hypothetical protein
MVVVLSWLVVLNAEVPAESCAGRPDIMTGGTSTCVRAAVLDTPSSLNLVAQAQGNYFKALLPALTFSAFSAETEPEPASAVCPSPLCAMFFLDQDLLVCLLRTPPSAKSIGSKI